MDYLEKLKAEQIELSNRICKLLDFIDSENYVSLSPNQQNLLDLQLDVMCTYRSILFKRLECID